MVDGVMVLSRFPGGSKIIKLLTTLFAADAVRCLPPQLRGIVTDSPPIDPADLLSTRL